FSVRGHPRRPEGWVRLLDRLRQDADVAYGVELPLERHALLDPRAADDLHALVEPLARPLHRDAEAAELVGLVAAPEAELEPPAREDVDHRPFLGDPERVREGGDDHRGADPRASRLARDRRGQD